MITLFIHENENSVAVGVQDQGIGISESKKASLFVRFENLLDKNLFNNTAAERLQAYMTECSDALISSENG